MKDVKEISEALYNWANESENRDAICIVAEGANETEDGCEGSLSVLINGKSSRLIDALVEAMRKDKRFENVVCRAAACLAVDRLANNLDELLNHDEEEGDDE